MTCDVDEQIWLWGVCGPCLSWNVSLSAWWRWQLVVWVGRLKEVLRRFSLLRAGDPGCVEHLGSSMLEDRSIMWDGLRKDWKAEEWNHSNCLCGSRGGVLWFSKRNSRKWGGQEIECLKTPSIEALI